MLVLTRKKDEEILIGGTVKIKVVDIGNGRIRLGIDAPPDVKVLRQEIVRAEDLGPNGGPGPGSGPGGGSPNQPAGGTGVGGVAPSSPLGRFRGAA